ncbi:MULTISPECIES: hypothetical protein [unclassified Brevundimonas]|uniref:hypothetical protein n=1 Tax=unclassified Brevundimonas TaxID=2622653 RepID=UPI0025C5A319|nr:MULTISPECIES: hypothetical protein [unclassified Brevundimonas]
MLKFTRKARSPIVAKAVFSVLWPTHANYDQFRALSDDELPRTLDGYISIWGPTEDYVDRGGGEFVRIPFDPQLMAAWCRSEHAKIDEAARAAYARYLLDTKIRPRR